MFSHRAIASDIVILFDYRIVSSYFKNQPLYDQKNSDFKNDAFTICLFANGFLCSKNDSGTCYQKFRSLITTQNKKEFINIVILALFKQANSAIQIYIDFGHYIIELKVRSHSLKPIEHFYKSKHNPLFLRKQSYESQKLQRVKSSGLLHRSRRCG